jgi:hypothetical protein
MHTARLYSENYSLRFMKPFASYLAHGCSEVVVDTKRRQLPTPSQEIS